MTSWEVKLNNGVTVEWEYICSLGSPGQGRAERGLIRAHFQSPTPFGHIDGFGTNVGDAIVDLLRACRDASLE